MKTPPMLRRFLVCVLVFAAVAVAAPINPEGGAEVPLAVAKRAALEVAQEFLPGAALASARLYRDLDGAPAVWALEYRAPDDDTPLTVVAAAQRDLPPVVMHWRGLPWHADQEYLARAQLADGNATNTAPITGMKADWNDLRWAGPLDLWVPRHNAVGTEEFAALRTGDVVSRAEVTATAVERRAALAARRDTRIAALWAEVDAPRATLAEGSRQPQATPRYGYNGYIPRVPYLNQTDSPDCGIVSMMNVLLYHDANGFPALVNEADLSGTRLQLRTLMQWTSQGTFGHNQFAGVRSFISGRGVTGFNFAYVTRGNYVGNTSPNLSFTDLTSEIAAGRPVQINLGSYRRTNVTDSDYGGHAVTGVGYSTAAVGTASARQWAIIHDNWKGSFTNPFIDVDAPYIDFSQANGVIKVVPPTRPVVAATVVAIDSPTNGSTVNLGSTATFAARVTTAAGVAVSRVEFRVGGVLLRSVTVPDANQPAGRVGITYSAPWTPSTAGPYSLTAIAVDSLNRAVEAATGVTVPVINLPPSVGWSAPQYDNAQFLTNNATDISVVANDNDGAIASIDFVLTGTSGSTTLGRTTPTAGATFTTLRNVTFPAPGSFTLRAIATDNRGATAFADRRITVTAAASSNNDAFTAAADLPTAGDVINTTTARATRETGEPVHAGSTGGRSLWWRWTPTLSGTAVITTRGSAFDTLLAVYTGTTLATLRAVVSNDDDDYSFTSYVRFPVVAGTTYQIAVDGYAGDNGLVTLTVLHSAASSTNDAFAARAIIPGTAAALFGNNIVASRETGEPAHAGVAGGRSLWWSWTAPDNGALSLATTGSTFDTVLAVYTGTAVGALIKVASDDDSGAEQTSSLSTPVTRGQTYQIAVDGFDADSNGRVRLALNFLAAGTVATNNAFATRAALTGATASVAANSAGATKETGEPNHAGTLGGASLWWTWTAPADGNVALSTEGSAFDTVLAVYTGTALNTLSLVAADDDSGDGASSKLTFAAKAGTAYQIAVDGYDRAAGPIVLYLTFSGSTASIRGRMISVATRGLAGAGSSTMIAGFNIAGSSPKPMLVRAIGPSLRPFGINNPIGDPVLTLFRGDTRLASNDNWEENANRASVSEKSALIGAFPLSVGAKDASFYTTLSPGGYTVQVSAAPGTSASGVTLVEVYDVDYNADAEATGRRLISLSTRGQVGTGTDVLIAGFVVLGPESRRVLVRGSGPALTAFGVAGVLANPQITVLRDVVVVAANDDWSNQAAPAAVATAAQAVGAFAFASGARDSALLLTLPPGGYTAQLSGVGGTTGVGLIEVYEVP
jgi:hypothetical protein